MEAFLRSSLSQILGTMSFQIYPYQGKSDLLSRLEERLKGYAAWLPASWRIIVLLDRDNDDCKELKDRLEAIAASAALSTRRSAADEWKVCFRLAIEELESWYFGDWEAVRLAYPRASAAVVGKATYRNCDQIVGGTWEAFEREMQKVGYFGGGLRKIEAARAVGRYFQRERCSSQSYKCLATALLEATGKNRTAASDDH